MARDNQYEVFEFQEITRSSHPKLVAQYSQEAEITEDMDEGEVRERMTAFVVSSGMAQTNYNLIDQSGTVSLDTLEKFSKRLRVEPYELLATIRRREIIDRDDFPVPKENVSDYHIDIGKLNTFIKSQPYFRPTVKRQPLQT